MSVQGIYAKYSAVTAGAQLTTNPGALHLVSITAAAAAATIRVYNNTSATGNPIAIVAAPINSTAWLDFEGLPFGPLGLFIVVAGAGAEAILTLE